MQVMREKPGECFDHHPGERTHPPSAPISLRSIIIEIHTHTTLFSMDVCKSFVFNRPPLVPALCCRDTYQQIGCMLLLLVIFWSLLECPAQYTTEENTHTDTQHWIYSVYVVFVTSSCLPRRSVQMSNTPAR